MIGRSGQMGLERGRGWGGGSAGRSGGDRDAWRLDGDPRFDRQAVLAATAAVQPALAASLWGDRGSAARAHLAQVRRLPDALVAQHGLGYVPPREDLILQAGQAAGVPLELLAEAGLVRRSVRRAMRAYAEAYGRECDSEDALRGFFEDRLRNDPQGYSSWPGLTTTEGRYVTGDWLTIPITVEGADRAGAGLGDAEPPGASGVGIGGFQFRSMRTPAEVGKGGRYRSPTNNAALQWSETLIGLPEETAAIQATGRVVLLEGKFDQLGVLAALGDRPDRPGVVGLGGLAVRGADRGDQVDRAGVLARLVAAGAEEVIIFVDGETDAGRGTRRAEGRLLSDEAKATLAIGPRIADLGLAVRVARVEEGARVVRGVAGDASPKDPSELWAAGGRDAILQALGRSQEFPAYAVRTLREEAAASGWGGRLWQRLQVLDTLLDTLGSWAERDDAAARAVQDLVAEAVGVPRVVVETAVERAWEMGARRQAPGVSSAAFGRPPDDRGPRARGTATPEETGRGAPPLPGARSPADSDRSAHAPAAIIRATP